MKISLNEIKKLVPVAAKVDTDELIKLIGSRLVEVEEKIDLAPKYAGIYIVKVVECEPIPDTHLHLCKIDARGVTRAGATGGATSGAPGRAQAPAEHDGGSVATGPVANGLVQVVCGAPNVRAGMLAVWIAPGAIVPQTYGEENFKLDVRKLRGHESHGMLAAIDELDLGEDHAGIAEIDPSLDHPTAGRNVAPGDSFAEVFGLNDIILDIENKSLTHRPDCFGLIGFAREVAGILGVPFESDLNSILRNDVASPQEILNTDFSSVFSPANEKMPPRRGAFSSESGTDEKSCIKVSIVDPTLCPRYSCALIEMKNAQEESKYLTKMDIFLAKAGMRGISKIVDVTNYLMLMTGQPLHAFDYDKFVKVGGEKDPKIIVRAAKTGEKLQLLDGKTVDLNENDIVITSSDVPVALAGAMGGKSTEIDASTEKVLLESATFSLYNLRKTQMAHGIFSEAITRFTKGQPASQTDGVLRAAVAMLGGTPLGFSDNYAKKQPETAIDLTVSDINSLLGTSYDASLIKTTLENVGFKVGERPVSSTSAATARTARRARDDGPRARVEETVSSPTFTILPPSWRTDIHIKEDLIEEVGRLLGYDNIPLSYPTRPFIGAETPKLLQLKNRLRTILSDKLAANEVLTYTFISQNLQETVGENPDDSYEIINSISPELQRFRQTLIPSLLEKTRDNLKSGYKDFSLYEINQVTKKSYGKDEDGVPKLYTHLAFVTTGDFYQMKANLVALLSGLGFKNPDFREYDGHFPYLEPLRSTSVTTPHICAGEVKQPILKRLKISEIISAFEIDLDELLNNLPETHANVINLSKFPSVERDITLKTPSEVPFKAAESAIKSVFSQEGLTIALTPISLYQASEDAEYRNLSFHLKFQSAKKTLESAEISAIMEKIAKNVKEAVGAEVV